MVKPSISIQSWYTLEEILVYLTKQRLKMAPGNNPGKAKGEKKKKDEKVLLVATDITINLPDETHVVLKVRS